MLKIESTGTVNGTQQSVYTYLADFRNFEHLLPSELLRDLKVTTDTIRFGIEGLGTVGLGIAEKKPFSQLVIKATEESAANFTFWFNISALADKKAQVSLLLEANLNMFLEMMAKEPLQRFADLIIDKMTTLEFDE